MLIKYFFIENLCVKLFRQIYPKFMEGINFQFPPKLLLRDFPLLNYSIKFTITLFLSSLTDISLSSAFLLKSPTSPQLSLGDSSR